MALNRGFGIKQGASVGRAEDLVAYGTGQDQLEALLPVLVESVPERCLAAVHEGRAASVESSGVQGFGMLQVGEDLVDGYLLACGDAEHQGALLPAVIDEVFGAGAVVGGFDGVAVGVELVQEALERSQVAYLFGRDRGLTGKDDPCVVERVG